jgi:hypothetical protein
MKKVKVIQAHRTVEGLFDEGDIFIQFFDQPFIFYPEEGDASGGGIDIRLMDKRGGYHKYFNDIEPVDISENKYFQRRVLEIKEDIAEIDDAIIDLQQRKKKLLKFIRID